MTERPTIKAKLNPVGHGEVSIDGKDVSRMITGLRIESKVGEVTTVVMRFIGANLDIEAEADIEATE